MTIEERYRRAGWISPTVFRVIVTEELMREDESTAFAIAEDEALQAAGSAFRVVGSQVARWIAPDNPTVLLGFAALNSAIDVTLGPADATFSPAPRPTLPTS